MVKGRLVNGFVGSNTPVFDPMITSPYSNCCAVVLHALVDFTPATRKLWVDLIENKVSIFGCQINTPMTAGMAKACMPK